MKKIGKIMSFLLVFILGFSTVVSAAPAPSNSIPVTTLSKSIIEKANQGDVEAQNQINSYFEYLIDAAKNGDAVAISKLQNLDCFNQEKDKAHFANLKVKPGETIKYYFDDGSAISISNSSLKTTNGTAGTASTTIHAAKTWYYGAAYAKITTYVDISSTRTVCHINDQWGVGMGIMCNVGDVDTSIVLQDGNPSKVQSAATATFVEPLPPGSVTLLVKYNVDTAGAMTEYFAS